MNAAGASSPTPGGPNGDAAMPDTTSLPDSNGMEGARGALSNRSRTSTASRPVRRRSPARSERLTAEGRRPLSSIIRRTASPTRRAAAARPRPRAWRGGAPGRDVRAAKRSTSPKGAPCCTWRFARRAPTKIMVDGKDVVPEVHEVLDTMAAFSDKRPLAANGRATPASASATSSTSASAAPISAPRWLTGALQNVHAIRAMTCASSPMSTAPSSTEATHGARPARDAVHHRLQDLHHARDHDQRGDRAQVADRGRRCDERPSPSISSRCRPTPRRSGNSASTPPTCSASGTGSAAATPWTPPSGCRP